MQTALEFKAVQQVYKTSEAGIVVRKLSRKEYLATIDGYLHAKFDNIKYRCNNPKAHNYMYYGGKGVKCLFSSVDEFISYVVNELQIDPRGLDIDRIDNDGNYERGNIRFITRNENLQNKGAYRKCTK